MNESIAKPTRGELKDQELRVQRYFAPGQLVNENARGARITHIATGITVQHESEGSLLQNTYKALRHLTDLVAATPAPETDQSSVPTHCGLCADGDADIRRDHACDVEDHWRARSSHDG
jgi:protein subunit release factor A